MRRACSLCGLVSATKRQGGRLLPERLQNLGTDQGKAFCPACVLRPIYPTKDGSFNVYDDLKKKLMKQGIPEDEIAFIHDADSEAKKGAVCQSSFRAGTGIDGKHAEDGSWNQCSG